MWMKMSYKTLLRRFASVSDDNVEINRRKNKDRALRPPYAKKDSSDNLSADRYIYCHQKNICILQKKA